MFMLILAPMLGATIIAGASAWGWRNGTLHTTEQERIDMEFERIVRRLDSRAR